MARLAAIPALFLTLVCYPLDATAQIGDTSGSVHLTNWPIDRPGPASGVEAPHLTYEDHELLPFIESLRVDYRFASGNDTDGRGHTLEFRISWIEGREGILNGRRVDATTMPSGIVIESVDLLMDVTKEARLHLPLHNIDLGPSPAHTDVSVEVTSFDSLLVDPESRGVDINYLSASDTRRIINEGFELSNIRMVRVVFRADPTAPSAADARTTGTPRQSSHRAVVVPHIDLWLTFRGFRGGWFPRMRQNTTRGERHAGGGRGRAERDDRDIPRRSRRIADESDDDDDDEDDRLYPAAIAGAVAIGAVALAGGTIGYYGSASKAPIGLMSGFVRPQGGALLYVAVNPEVLGAGDGSESFFAGITAFYNMFDRRSPKNPTIHPAIGLGVYATEEGSDDVRLEGNVSVGLVGTAGPAVLLAGYDITTRDIRFGVGVNLRRW